MSYLFSTEEHNFNVGYRIGEENWEYLNDISVRPQLYTMRDMPDRVDPRKHDLFREGWLRTENQGSIGSCQGASLTECLEYCYTVATNKVEQFSKMFAYLTSQMENNIRSDSGSTLSGGTRAISNKGCCRDSVGHYPARYPGWNWITEPMKEDAQKYKLKSATVMKSADQIRDYIGSGIGIVQIGIAWGPAMTPNSRDYSIKSFSPGRGGHAVTFCGYVPDSDINVRSTKGYWLIMKNSWGTRWGNKGFAYVDPRAVDQMMGHRFTVMLGRSDLETPEPRKIDTKFTDSGGSIYG